MLKKVCELDKDERIILLSAIANDEINPSEYDESTFVAIQYTDWFLSLLIRDGNEGMKVICISEAALARESLIKK
jgi:hypothetical protein